MEQLERIRQGMEPEDIAAMMSREYPWNYLTRDQRRALETVVRAGTIELAAPDLNTTSRALGGMVSRARVNLTEFTNLPTVGIRIYLLWDRSVRERLVKGA